jgi:cell division protein FtsA
VLGPEQVRQSGALFIDVGGGTTDVALVRQGGLEGTRMYALGGRANTKSIADRLELPFPRAEALKVDYARGIAGDRAPDVREIVADDVAVWAAGVELVMEELAAGDLLPGRIYLCGGGSRLPEIRDALADKAFADHLPFARPPEVTILAPEHIDTVRDETRLLEDQQDVTPMGLAYQAIELGSAQNPLDAALRRVIRAMKQ